MNTTAKSRIVVRAFHKLLSQINLPWRVIHQAYPLMAQASRGDFSGVAEFLRSQLWRCSGALASVVALTADLVA